MTATSQQRPRSKSFGDRVRELRERARQEAGLDYQLLRFIIFFLVGIGVLMVFSSSMATSLTEDGGVWNQALRQCVMVFLGLVAFWFGLKVSPHTPAQMRAVDCGLVHHFAHRRADPRRGHRPRGGRFPVLDLLGPVLPAALGACPHRRRHVWCDRIGG